MEIPLFSTESLHIAYRPDLGQLTARWLRSVSEAELRDGYTALRRAALHYQCGRWLIDSRRRTNRRLNGPEWVTTQFLPQAQQALGQPLRVCFLVLPDYLASLPTAATAAPPGSPVQFARFVDEGAANAWLGQR
ncbi:hypothetical protein GCM10023172_35470 [Hymenobacter ginsengisoli]|uniref:STAS/SEC14 domain-containing protein n=1 Tax=Hymenobacter ginsengisoli TaxID=1051626 RepID=A0ABP8QPM5_9BACT|nr:MULTISPECIES: hypothetical protein [unclassified Hymenobacter]MBO2033125.1 hypothetical protein [Hymenobacter sp. BT559]